MADITLRAAPVFGGVDMAIGANRIVERDDFALVSVATPLGGETSLAKAMAGAFDLAIPAPTMSTMAGSMRAIRTAPDQLMLMFPSAGPDPDGTVSGKLGGAGYTTDQTHAWVILEISGPETLAALERMCPLDLHAAAFPAGSAARTVMEHLGVIIIRTADHGFLLLSASSSARSFLHAIETSYRNVAPGK